MHECKVRWAAVLTAALPMIGCAGSMSETTGASTQSRVSTAEVTETSSPAADARAESTASGQATRPQGPSEAEAQPQTRPGLPSAPWSEEPLPPKAAPTSLLQAWRQADNRNQCAPVAPRGLGAGEGAESRMTALHGGWSVAFDKPGAPGIRSDGSTCDECGRAAFGIAGTGMSPQELAFQRSGDFDPSFEDGSSAEFETSDGDGATSATLRISGQKCVYQVWSFLGEDHVRDLVEELRFVAVREAESGDRMAQLSSR